MKARVAERGQVTIPKKLRKQLGIRAGTVLVFETRGHVIVISKNDEVDPIQKVYGCLGKELDTDTIVNELRGEHDNKRR